jgi:hypothetical protein
MTDERICIEIFYLLSLKFESIKISLLIILSFDYNLKFSVYLILEPKFNLIITH